jgi:peptidoglycan/LPS O-acetylase OafA/YrhL
VNTERATPAPQSWPFRYELIDGCRGVAAFTVVMHHLGIVTVGHYAVMIFFVISGYCVGAAAESGRRNGMSLAAFMVRRAHRIYPPYLLAVAFFVVVRAIKAATGGHNDLARPWSDWLQNLTLTQWVSLPFHPLAAAAQNPKLMVAAFWSLNYEEQFYLVMGLGMLLAVRRRFPLMAGVAALGAVGLTWNLIWPAGWVTGIFIEYWAHFAVGVLLFAVLCLWPSRLNRLAFVVAVSALLVFCLLKSVPWTRSTELDARVYAELAVVSAFALLLFFARPLSAAVAGHAWWRPIAGLGVISYSLYLVHQFNLTLVGSVADKLVPAGWTNLRLAAMTVLELGIATAFWYCCERPFLNRRTARQSAPAPLTDRSVSRAA